MSDTPPSDNKWWHLTREDVLNFPGTIPDTDEGSQLHFAAILGDVELMVEILKKFANAFPPGDSVGESPFHWAVREGKLEMLKLLAKQFPTESLYPDEDGTTPLQFAIELGEKECVKFLNVHTMELFFQRI
jgi:ankyrin repeat protein